MAINFHPGYGTLLYCNFDHQEEPEMIKNRPSVVVSRKNGNIGLCTVVPLSGTEPFPMQPWHHKMSLDKLPRSLRGHDWWAKCDCLTSVSFKRLDRIFEGKDWRTGKRIYVAPKLFGPDLLAIKLGVQHHLGLVDLISTKK